MGIFLLFEGGSRIIIGIQKLRRKTILHAPA
jgi:hypothetical protein